MKERTIDRRVCVARFAQFADEAVIIDHGRLVASGRMEDLLRTGGATITIRCSSAADLLAELDREGISAQRLSADSIVAHDTDETTVGNLALRAGVATYQMVSGEQSSLENVFLRLASPTTVPAAVTWGVDNP